MFAKQTIKDIKPRGKIILVRTDYNLPLAADGSIISDLRLRSSLPTIQYLLDHGAKKLILISHLGRPAGQKIPNLSLSRVATRLQTLLPNHPVQFIADVSGPDVESAVRKLPRGGILLLENLRFYPGEEKNSADFASEIVESTHADYFVQDGFAVLHRAHASTAAITQYLPGVAGLLVEREITMLSQLLHRPKTPFLVIIGGAKVDDKQPLIARFLNLADRIAVGGKIAADGYGSSDPEIFVATDFVTDSEGSRLDLGPDSTQHILELIHSARTILWNGTTGFTSQSPFDQSSIAIASALGRHPGTTIICGGDTAAFVEQLQLNHPDFRYSLVSTGGGAALEFLSGLELPGLAALEDAE